MVTMAKQTKKRSMTTDDETREVRSRNTLAIAIIAVGAAKKNEMTVFKIITLKNSFRVLMEILF